MSEMIIKSTADHIKVKGGEYVQDTTLGGDFFKADTPQTELLVKTPHKSRESHEKKCETCRDKDTYDEWQGNCDECENGSMYTPQTEEEILREQCRAFIDIVKQTERSFE